MTAAVASMRLRCWLDEPPAYTLDVDVDTRLVLDCPAAVLRSGSPGAEADDAAAPGRTEWLTECADATAVLISDHSTLGALPVLTERTSFDGEVLLTRPAAQIGRWLLESIEDEPGPTPICGVRDEPWQPEPFDDALDGFVRIGSEPA